MKIECPTCESTEFTKLSLIYAEGLSDLNARSRGWGLLFGGGGADIALGSIRTKGEIQTRLSKSSSPPRKWSYWKIAFGGLIGLLVLEFTLGYVDTLLRVSGDFNQQLAWLGYGWLGVFTFLFCLAGRHNFGIYPRRYRIWERSVMCRCCGYVLQLPDGGNSASHPLIREAQR